MKKSFRTVMIAMFAIMFVFVSCAPAPDGDVQGRAILTTDGTAGRSLTVADPSFEAGTLYWKYATQKVDTLEFTTGQTASYDEAGAVKVAEGTGLKGSVGPFSQGLWNFKLFAYTDADCQNLAWSGETLNQRIVAGNGNRVAVKVSAQQTDGKTGSLAIGDIALKDGTSAHAAMDKSNLTQVVRYWKDGTSEEKAITNTSTAPFTSLISDIPSGGYWVEFKYVDTADTSTVRGSEKKWVNIFDNVTTTIGGFLSENTGSAEIEAQSEVKKAVSPEVPVVTEQPTKLEVAATPESGKTEQKTAVDIPAGVLKSEDGSAKVDVTTYTAPKANEMFTVTDGSGATALAGLDLTLTQATAGEVTKFDQPVTVTTYIAKGLDPANIDVKYSGAGDQPIFEKNDLSTSSQSATGYNPTTGELRFQTTHFSQFFVTSTDVGALNSTSNKVYATLSSAAAEAKAGDTVLIMKDIEAVEKIEIPIKGFAVDGLGHRVSGEFNFTLDPVLGGTIKNVRFYDISNAKNTLSPIYGSRLKGKVVIADNEFHAADWDVIQITPTPGAEIIIENNLFEHKPTPGADVEPTPNRFVHIESRTAEGKYDTNCDFSVVVTGNTMLDCASLRNCGIEVYWPANPDKVHISGNYVDAPFAVCIMTTGSKPAPEWVLPFIAGPNGEPAFEPVAYYSNADGNYFFTETLDEAIDKVMSTSGDTIGLVADASTAKSIPENVNVIYNGHSILALWDGSVTSKMDIEKKVVKNGQGASIDISNAPDLAGIMANVSDLSVDCYPLTINITGSINLDGGSWTPAAVNVREVIINGNNHSLANMNCITAGNAGFIGNVGGGGKVTINDLAIEKATIIGDENDVNASNAVAAFVAEADGAAMVAVSNCSLLDSTVKGGHWVGGIVGTASGYNVLNNGPVFLEVTVDGCTVRNTEISGKGSAGGVTGHATRNPWTLFTINAPVMDTVTVTSTGSSTDKAGSLMGTVGVAGTESNGKTGGVYVTDTSNVKNVTVTSGTASIDRIYGRVGSTGGKLYLDGDVIASL